MFEIFINGQFTDDFGVPGLQRKGKKHIFPNYNNIESEASKTRGAN